MEKIGKGGGGVERKQETKNEKKKKNNSTLCKQSQKPSRVETSRVRIKAKPNRANGDMGVESSRAKVESTWQRASIKKRQSNARKQKNQTGTRGLTS